MIQLDKSYFETLNKEKINELLDLAQPYFAHRTELYHRYRRKSLSNEMMNGGKDKTIMPSEYRVAKSARGYLSGKAPTYTVTEGNGSDEYQQRIDYIRRYNDDGAIFDEAMNDYLIKTAAYLYITENENNEIVYTRLDSLNTICFYDYGTPPYPIALMKVWQEGKIQKIEIITDKLRRIFSIDGESLPFEDFGESGAKEMMTEKSLFWGDVPIATFEEPDGVAVFEPAISLIENGETVLTNASKTLQYNDLAKLKISGYHPENQMFITDEKGNRTANPAWKQEEKELYEASAIFLNESDGDVQWLIKNVDFDGSLAYLTYIENAATAITGVPNMTDEAISKAASGSALGYMLYALEQIVAAPADRVFKKGYLRLWEIITNRLNLKGNKSYDFRDIDIRFTRNIPTDKDLSIQRAATAYGAGLVSLETGIGQTGIEVDAQSESLKIAEEKLRIRDIQGLIKLRDARLLDNESALKMLYDEEKAKEIMAKVKEQGLQDEFNQ